ncbi:zinc-finger domain-containing protein [Rhodospirillum sp. A1_3_36]|uniref:zinc-finger domain-containing protein n=1 Tax=Rhodospirillum sp. A1_3_36 TaxID=3391666 RepID=UPI0039A5A58D
MSHVPTFPVSETLSSDSLAVACDGGDGGLGHPTVYLHIKPEIGHVVCPYCSRKYVATEKALSHSGH